MELNLTRPIAFFDLETTGIHIAKDRIVEISIIKINPDQSQEILTKRVNPTIPISEESTFVHGISDDDVKDEPTFSDLANELSAFIGNSDLGGYNSIKFDLPLLVEEFLRAGISFDLKNRKMIDVQNIFHKMEPRTLKAAYKFYCQKDLIDAHSAEADTLATYEVLKAQLDKYENEEYTDKEGNTSKPIVNDVSELADFSHYNKNADLVGQIVYNEQNQEVFNFGKNKGKLVETVFAREPQYYDWMMKADFPLSTKKVITSIKLRGFNKGASQFKNAR